VKTDRAIGVPVVLPIVGMRIVSNCCHCAFSRGVTGRAKVIYMKCRNRE